MAQAELGHGGWERKRREREEDRRREVRRKERGARRPNGWFIKE